MKPADQALEEHQSGEMRQRYARSPPHEAQGPGPERPLHCLSSRKASLDHEGPLDRQMPLCSFNAWETRRVCQAWREGFSPIAGCTQLPRADPTQVVVNGSRSSGTVEADFHSFADQSLTGD